MQLSLQRQEFMSQFELSFYLRYKRVSFNAFPFIIYIFYLYRYYLLFEMTSLLEHCSLPKELLSSGMNDHFTQKIHP